MDFEKAVMLFKTLPNLRSQLCGNYFYGVTEATSIVLEKYMGVLVYQILKEAYGMECSFKGLPQYANELGCDFSTIGDEVPYGLYQSGDYFVHGNPLYADCCVLADMLDSVCKKTGWGFNVYSARLGGIYFKLVEETGEDIDLEQYAESRSNAEFVDDVGLDDLFVEEDVLKSNDNPFWDLFRGLFDADDTHENYCVVFRSELLPYAQFIDEERVRKEDREYYDLLLQCMDVLKCSAFLSGETIFLIEKGLSYGYVAIQFYCYDDGFTNDERLGMIASDPRLYLVPYLLNECIRRLDMSMHFLPEEVLGCA